MNRLIICTLKFRIIWRKRQKKTKKNLWLKINPKHWVNILPVKHLMVYLPGTSPPAYFQVVGILNESIRLAKHFFHFLFHFFFLFLHKMDEYISTQQDINCGISLNVNYTSNFGYRKKLLLWKFSNDKILYIFYDDLTVIQSEAMHFNHILT